MVKSASFVFITQGPKGVTQIGRVKCQGLLTLISVRLFISESELMSFAKDIQQAADAHIAHGVKLVDESP